MESRNPVTLTGLLLDRSRQPSWDVPVDAGFLQSKAVRWGMSKDTTSISEDVLNHSFNISCSVAGYGLDN
jgi:hypothetical protein